MSMSRPAAAPSLLVLALATAAMASAGCGDKGGYRGGSKSPALKWLESPKSGSQEGNFLKIPSLGAQLELPETRYVFKECTEPSHSPEGPNKWVPVFRCASEGYSGGGDELAEDSGDAVAMTLLPVPGAPAAHRPSGDDPCGPLLPVEATMTTPLAVSRLEAWAVGYCGHWRAAPRLWLMTCMPSA